MRTRSAEGIAKGVMYSGGSPTSEGDRLPPGDLTLQRFGGDEFGAGHVRLARRHHVSVLAVAVAETGLDRSTLFLQWQQEPRHGRRHVCEIGRAHV